MARLRLRMRQIREVLRLRFERGLSQREIARAVSASVGAVCEYLRRAKEAGLSWPLPEEFDDAALEAKLFSEAHRAVIPKAPPDCSWIHRELRRKGVTLQLLHLEYLEANPGGYRYSQFCEHYKRFREKLNPTMRQVHRAGEKVFVDFSGQRPEVVDPATGEVREVELFVGVLGASNYAYAEAVETQKLPHWIRTHVRMLEYFGGSPELFIPDNLKSGVTRACRYEPGVNRSYDDLARHYGAAVIPARSGHAKDKAKVESGVQVAQRWILAALRNRTFFSLAELNEAIAEKLEILNSRPMQKIQVSRRELFENLDRPALMPLPANRYTLAFWKTVTVNIDYHIDVEHNYYSVPYQLVREKVEARYTATTVEVYFKGKRVGSHTRLAGKGKHSTKREHMPRAHREHAEWTPSRIISWAKKSGPATGRVVAKILESKPHPEQGYRACLGIIRLGRTHGKDRLEAACRRAEHLGAFTYRTVKNVLSSGADRLPLDEQESTFSTPEHPNIRGATYYH
jgi:transposase